MRIPSGSTDRYIYFVAVDATDLKTRETGLTGFTVYRSRNGGAAAAYTTPTVNETDVTNMPGVYELLIDEDTTLTAGNDAEAYCVHITQASMAPVTREIEIYRPETTEGNTLGVASDGDISGNVDGNVVGSVASVTGAVGSVTGAVGSVTAAVTLPTIPANWITAAGINASALNGKGDWNVGKTGYSLTQTFPTNFADMAITVTTGALTVDTLAANTVDAASIAASALDGKGNWNIGKTGYSLTVAPLTAAQVNAECDTAIADAALATAASIAALNDLSASQVNAEVVDALATDNYAEPGQGAPPASTTLAAKINYLYKNWRNRKTQDATTWELYADDATTVDQKATVSDDGTDAEKGEIAAGP